MGHCLTKERRIDGNDALRNGRKSKKSRKSKSKPKEVTPPLHGRRSSREIFSTTLPLSQSSNEINTAAFPIVERSSSMSSAGNSAIITSGNQSVAPSPVGSESNDNSAISPIPSLSSYEKRGKSSPMRRMFNSPKLAPRVLFKSPLPKHLSTSLRREKNNSTSSMYITDTINSPNVDEVIRCMASALLYHIKNGMAHPEGNIDRIFSERYHPLTREALDLVSLPEMNTIYRYVNMIFVVQRLPPECAILCLAYIERILDTNRIVLHPENWRRIVFGSILIATKVWEDESVWNVDFLDVFPLLTLIDLNNLENRFMELLQFNVLIVGSEYAKYYFELRALSQQNSFPLEPLNKEAQSLLEEKSHRTNQQIVKRPESFRNGLTPKRARSVDFFDPKSPPAVLA